MIYMLLAVALGPLLIIGLVVTLTNPGKVVKVLGYGLKYLGWLLLITLGVSIVTSILVKPIDNVVFSQNLASLILGFLGIPVFSYGIYSGYRKNCCTSPDQVSADQSQIK